MKECNLHGFVIEKTEHIDYIHGDLVTLRHEKTKMPLFFVDREDSNKSFAIGFMTEPCDDSGVFHIIEHSVLCGSKKYPVKEPFAELMRSTVSTYLNALTYNSFTLYPVSSMIDKALFDMMDVYLDAVFNPLVLENELIFLQEGHRLEQEDGYILPNGVVLNEMREDYNSIGELVEREVGRLLYPNNCERYVSGGVPKDIIGLSYERFCEILRHHYHPSNAFCMLDGSVDIERALKMIDEYVSAFEYKEYPKKDDTEEELNTEPRYADLQISPDDEPASRLFLFNRIKSDSKEDEDLNAAAITVITHALTVTNNSPLRAAVLELGLCNNMRIKLYDVGMVESIFSGIEVGKEEELAKAYKKLLEEKLDEIIDKADLLASINAFDFALREQDSGSTPRGMVYMFDMAEYYADGSDVAEALRHDKQYATLRTLVGTDFFRRLAHKVLIDSPTATLCLRPTTEEQNDGLDEAMEELLEEMTNEEVDAALEKSKALTAWQSTPDKEEALATIPRLSLSDLEFVEDKTPTLFEQIGTVPVLYHPIEANEITYMDLLFDISDLTIEELQMLQIYALCIGDLHRENATPEWLEVMTNSYLGAADRSISMYNTQSGSVRIALAFSVSFLDKNIEPALDVIGKYIAIPKLDDPSIISFRIKQWLDSRKKSLRTGTNTNRVASMGYDTKAYINHSVNGIGLYDWISSRGAEGCAELIEQIEGLVKRVLTKKRLTIGLTGKTSPDKLAPLVDVIMGSEEDIGDLVIAHPAPTNKLIITNENVARCSYVAPIPSATDIKGSSVAIVLSTLLEYDLLWNEIRIKGGAYSTGIYISRRRGFVLCYTSSDPSPERSIEIFRNLGRLAREYIESIPDITQYIISAFGEERGITTPRMNGGKSTDLYYSERTLEESEAVIRGILSVTREDLIEACDRLFCLENGHYAVMCDEETAKKFEKDAEIFYRL